MSHDSFIRRTSGILIPRGLEGRMLRQRRPLTMLVLACALFLRMWVPAGWMPSANGGAFAIEPCVAAAPMPMDHGSNHDPSHKAQHDGDCSFAPHHAGMAPIAPPAA